MATLHKGVNYWKLWPDAVDARAAVLPIWPDARIVRYERGWAVQFYKSGPYLPEEPS